MADSHSSNAQKRALLKQLLRDARNRTDAADERIAVIGMAGRYPGAGDLNEFWANLAAGRNSVREVPADRWDWRQFSAEKNRDAARGIYTRWGGFIDGVDEFDPLFFSVSPLEAQAMDPQERLFLQTAWHALEDAGQTRRKLAAQCGGEVGVFVGVMNSHYEWFNAEARQQGAISGAHSHFWSLANRLSYFLNLTGPSFAVDSACSASLTAIHLACESLRRGECRAAIAGGVNLILHPLHYHKLCLLEMLSPDGDCKAFGDGANGFVDGEGVGALVLKPLRAAVADGDRIHGVILGSAVNAGGKTGGYTVPNPQAQKKLVQRALERAKVSPDRISYIEAHGTGTSLGDPIEVAGLQAVFGDDSRQAADAPTAGRRVVIGSAKSNIGHLESAAGVAGLTKVLLQLKHRRLVPSINAAALNPKIDWAESSVELQRTGAAWPAPVAGGPRCAGVSSFGAGGANAHLIVEEYLDPADAAPSAGASDPQVLVLSAKNEDRLRAQATRLASWLEAQPENAVRSSDVASDSGRRVSLADIAFTLQTGREPLESRLAFVAATTAEAAAKLRAFAGGQPGALHHGRVNAGRGLAQELLGTDGAGQDFVAAVIARRDADRLARLWVAGAEVEWTEWHHAAVARPRLVSLPGYAFARERYWIGGERKPVAPVGTGASPALPAASAAAAETAIFTPGWRPVAPATSEVSLPAHFVVGCASDATQLLAAWRETGRPRDALRVEVGITRDGGPGAAAAAFDQANDHVATNGSVRRIIFVAGGGWETAGSSTVPAEFTAVLQRLQHSMDATAAPVAEVVCLGRAESPVLGALRGLLRTAAAERPSLRVATVGVVANDTPEFWRRVITAALTCPTGFTPTDLQLEGAEFRVLGWNRAQRPIELGARDARAGWRERGVYVITGGLGGLGRIVARHLARTCSARLALIGRSAATADTQAFLAELQRLGGDAVHVRADLASATDCARAWAEIKARFGAVHGLIHAAGVTRDRALAQKTAEDAAAVFAGKVQGLRHLDEVSRTEPLEHVVLFASVSGVIGNFGQADYAAANGYLDAFAAERNRRRARGERHGHTVAIDWPLWASGGMTLDGAHAAQAHSQFGLVPLGEAEGLAVLDAAVTSSHERLLVWSGDATWIERALNPVVVASPGHAAPEGTAPAVSRASLVSRTEAFLRELISGPIKLLAAQIEVDRRLEEYGIDSVLIRAFHGRLEPVLPGVPVTVFFEYPTVRALTDYLVTAHTDALTRALGAANVPSPAPAKNHAMPNLGETETNPVGPIRAANGAPRVATTVGRVPASATSTTAVVESRTEAPAVDREAVRADEPIAIVGLSGRYPGARNVDEFWTNLAAGRDLIRDVPPERWDAARFHDPDPSKAAVGKAYCQRGGFLSDVDHFDPLFFGISPLEAKAMDPQERIFLELAWEALEDAGYTRAAVDRNVGVFVGVTTLSYALHGAEAFAAGKPIMPSSVPWSLANRVSFVFDLTGPSVPVDTACSASLTAIHFACESLRRGECRAAIVGGINLYLHPLKYTVMCQTRMLSRSGFCHSFGEGGDGFIPGEGGGALVLKPLSRAQADGDHIYGLVKGTAINHGGRTNGYTVPNPRAQSDLIRAALAAANVDPRTISYLEAHGTGTVLGDPIEVEGLTQAFRAHTTEKQFCALGSVKSAIGHLEAAAGIAGVTKVLLQMKHGRFAPTLHAETPNRHIDFAGSPFYLQRELAPWPRPEVETNGQRTVVPRRAGISSFGAGGANAHVIIEEYVEARVEAAEPTGPGPQLLVLSARTKDRLQAYARRLASHVGTLAADPTRRPGEFADLAATLQIGREVFAERLALLARSPAEAAAKLDGWVNAEKGSVSSEVWHGRAAPGGMPTFAVSSPPTAEELARCGAAWVSGAAVDWSALRGARPLRRVSAPTYPFAPERYWFDDLEPAAPTVEVHATPASKPWYGAMPGEMEFGPAGDAVGLEMVDGAIAVVTMRDRANRNMFSEKLLRGLLATFSDLQRRPEIKAVVVTGIDNVFSMGGTREGLLGLADKKAQFTDIPFLFRGFLECPVPVIAAVQGHASGGGLLFGLYADFTVLAADGVYSSNFLKYGFTPGMGATLILPEKLGAQLATEMMFTAASFTGEALQQRGAAVRVQPAPAVLPEALMIARSLAEKPAAALRELKRELAGRILERMPQVLARELAMHERTFGAPEVRARIEATFGRGQVVPDPGAADVTAAPAIPAPDTSARSRSASAPLDRAAPLPASDVPATAPATTPAAPLSFAEAVTAMWTQKNVPAATRPAAPAQPAVVDEAPVADFIFSLLQRLLHVRRESVDVDASFNQLGLDSISGVEFVRDLNKRFALNLEAVALYDHGSVARLTAFVAQQVAARAPGAPAQPAPVQPAPAQPVISVPPAAQFDTPPVAVGVTPADRSEPEVRPLATALPSIARRAPAATPARVAGKVALKSMAPALPPTGDAGRGPASEHGATPATPVMNTAASTPAAGDATSWPEDAIAVVGLACRYPGASDQDAFWRNLVAGVDTTGEVPPDRWTGGPAEKHLRTGGFLSDVDRFDAEFFKLLPIEAEYMEPQQRLFLEECWKALEDAGFSQRALAGRKCGVFVGASTGDYFNGLEWAGRENGIAHAFTGGSPSILAARISYHLDLTGPSIALDTACSSSLVAVHQACRSLLAGDADLALAGGVSLMLSPQTHIMTGKAGMLSPTGHCRPFDRAADGIVISEGVGVVVLQRLSAARRERRQIYGVIRATAVNQDGRTNGIMAPSARSQAALLAEAQARAGVQPADITFIEAHGTGTGLGDPIEVKALRTTWGDTGAAAPCALGSVKSNIGHAMLAAGVAGLIKTLLALRHRTLPPTAHFTAENEHLRLEGSPFFVPTQARAWMPAACGRRIAGVSSFGFSGTNAHVVVEEWPAPPPAAATPVAWPTLVSARDEAGLRARLRGLRLWLEGAGAGADIADVGFTLANGRSHFPVRWSGVAVSTSDLADQLDAVLADGMASTPAPRPPAPLAELDAAVERWLTAGAADKAAAVAIAAAYTAGADLADKLTRAAGRIIGLPAYPFARRRFWIEERATVPEPRATVSPAPRATVAEAPRPPAGDVPLNAANSVGRALEYVQALVAAETKLEPSRLDVNADFEACGLNSVIIAGLNQRLERDFGALPSTLFFTYKSIAAIATYLAREHGERVAALGGRSAASVNVNADASRNAPSPVVSLGDAAAARPEASVTAGMRATEAMPVGTPSDALPAPADDIAIIGMEGRFPEAANLAEYWANLKAGRDCVSEIPADRWDYRRFWTEGAGKRDGIYCKWGGFIADADKFDAAFFNIAPREARFMDPQERVFLETVWGCLEDAGYTRARLQDTAAADRRAPVGVFVGVSLTDYQLHGGEAWGRGEAMPVNSQIYALANRVSYFLNLGGPSLPVDTACSSSLYALHLACESIRSGECRMALAGGVNLSLHPNKYLTLCLGQFAASDGRCRAFGEGGDGYVPAEGVGVVLLKPLAAALRDGDQIHAVIRGTAVNHDGKTHGFTVPNPVAQTEVIRRALGKARLSADAVSYIEAHGTGTALGDPIEIAGLTDAFAVDTQRKQYCAIGSVKSNIGHAEAAAGIAQLFKVVLQMKHRTLVPNLLHSDRPNSRINFAQTPFRLQTTCSPWPQDAAPRCAGVSSFGVGGVNVHVVVQEAPAPAASGMAPGPFVLPLSAKSEWSLREAARRLRLWLEAERANRNPTDALNLAEVAYTLQVGREAMAVRAAVVATTGEEAIERLRAIELASNGNAIGTLNPLSGPAFGTDAEDRAYLRQLATDGKWEKLARRWVEGALVDWDSLYTTPPRRISLPTYAFQRERYWQFDAAPGNAPVAAAASLPPVATTGAGSLREQLVAATVPERQRLLLAHVQSIVGELLAFAPPNTAPLDKGLFELGMESVQNAQLVARLATDTGLELYPTVTFDYPNVRALAAHLAHQFAANTAPAAVPVPAAPSSAPAETFFIEETWEPANLPAPLADPRQSDAPVLLLAHDDDARTAVEEALRARGDRGRVILVKTGYSRVVEREDVLSIDPRAASDYGHVVDVLGSAAPVRVLHGWSDRPFSPHPEVLAAQLERAPYAVFHLVQALMRRATKGAVRLVCVTRATEEGVPHAAALRALLRSVTQENPAFDCRLLECGHEQAGGLSRADWTGAVDELLRGAEAGVDVRHEPGRRLVRVLREFALPVAEEVELAQQPVVLITGGLGGLGLLFAEHFARTRRARLVLAGRSAVAPHDPRLRRLEELGAEVLYVRADVGHRGEADTLVAAARKRFEALDGVIHAAGVLRDAFVPTKKTSDWHEVLAPKVYGSVYLDEATREERLQFFVVLSSLTAAVGNAGQTDYAYANCFQQDLMRWRAREASEGRRAGRSIAVNWPLWAEGGMKVDPAMQTFLRDVIGLELLPKTVGLDVLDRALGGAGETFTVLHGVRSRIASHLRLKLRSETTSAPTPMAPATEAELEAALEAELRAAAKAAPSANDRGEETRR